MNIRRAGLLIVAILLASMQGAAEPRWQLPTATERHAADVASWGTAIGGLSIETVDAWRAPNRVHALTREGERVGLTYAAVFAAKLLVHRLRPCAPDCGTDNPDFSFFSGHTAVAFQAVGGTHLAFTVPLAISTGGLRVAAGKHWPTDVLAGAAVGIAISRLR